MPMYNFDPAEEQDDLLEQELLDHGRDGSLTGPNAKVSWKVFRRVVLINFLVNFLQCLKKDPLAWVPFILLL